MYNVKEIKIKVYIKLKIQKKNDILSDMKNRMNPIIISSAKNLVWKKIRSFIKEI